VSRKSKKVRTVRVLSHYQASDFPGTTYVPEDVARLLVNRLVSERLSQKVIRMFAPEAVFAAIKMDPEVQRYIPDAMPPAEVEGTYFQEPADAPHSSNVPRTRNLPRFREVYADPQLLISKGSKWQWPEGMEPALPASV
jgi:hypothetical protein